MSELFIARHARVLQLTLNRPQARNALNNAPDGWRLRHQR